jgi:flagellar export protein FliJ
MTTAYRFALAPVLTLRKSMEEHELRLLEKLQHEITHTVQQLEMLTACQQATVHARERELAPGTSAAQLQFLEQVLRRLQEGRLALERMLAELQTCRQQQLASYETAKRKREVLSDLRDRQRKAHDAQVERQEQRVTDDGFLARSRRE